MTPCVQFPMVCGSVRRSPFAEIWHGPRFLRVREIRLRNLPVCSTCSTASECNRCPGLAYLESGDFRAPSSLNCEDSFARTGIRPALAQLGSPFAAIGASAPPLPVATLR